MKNTIRISVGIAALISAAALANAQTERPAPRGGANYGSSALGQDRATETQPSQQGAAAGERGGQALEEQAERNAAAARQGARPGLSQNAEEKGVTTGPTAGQALGGKPGRAGHNGYAINGGHPQGQRPYAQRPYAQQHPFAQHPYGAQHPSQLGPQGRAIPHQGAATPAQPGAQPAQPGAQGVLTPARPGALGALTPARPGAPEALAPAQPDAPGALTPALPGARGTLEGRALGPSQEQMGAEPPAMGPARISPDQEARIRDSVRNDSWARADRADFGLNVGARVPRGARLAALPEDVVTIVPGLRGYKFVIVEDEIVIVDPGSYRVAAVIPEAGRPDLEPGGPGAEPVAPDVEPGGRVPETGSPVPGPDAPDE